MAIPKKLAILHRHISLGIPITRHILHGPNSYQLSGLNSHALFGHSRSFSAPTGLSPPTIRDRITSLWAYIAKSSTAYYRGSKLLLEQTRQVRDLKSRQERHQYKVSRREFVLIKTNTDDAFRVVPFFIILILIPETLPLFLIKGANIIPSTCILPEQLAARRLKLKDVRVQLSLDAIESIKMGSVFDPVTLASHETMKHLAAVQPQHFIIDNMSHEQLVQYSKLMGFPTWRTTWLLKNKLQKHFRFLKQDDTLLKKEGLGQLTIEELETACEDRGIASVGVTSEDLVRHLQSWVDLHTTTDPIIQPGLMMLNVLLRTHDAKV